MSQHPKLDQIRKGFESRRTRPYDWRMAQLQNLKRFLTEKNEEINQALWKDLRKGGFESEVSEQGIVLGEIEYTLRHLAAWMKPARVSTPLIDQPGSSDIHCEPYGVVLIIGAWNYPVNLLLAPLVGALAGGNAVVMKPSEISPATSAVMARWIPEYLDKEAVLVIEGGVEATDALLDYAFDYIFFTGSGPVGKIIMRKAAENLTPVTLELGGKSPAIITEDASIQIAARRIVWGKFMNAGQTCVAPDYVLIHPSIEKEFLTEVKLAIESSYGKDPKQSPDYCRIVNDKNFQRLEKFLTDGEIVCGGKSDAQERYIEPTVLRLPSAEFPIMKEEIFGPILPVICHSEIDETIRFINARPKPLSLYLFSKNASIRDRIVEETSSGGVCVNDVVMQMASPYLPFGGVGASGMGHYHGKQSFETFTHQKGVMKKSTWPDFTIRYAPHTPAKLNWVKRLS